MNKRLAVIGGGASGLAAVIEAATTRNNIEIVVFDKMPKLGKKILATGNGRCNFTNTDLSPKHFYGNKDFLIKVLTSPYADDENFFRRIGVLTYCEDGRIYPKSQQASTIRESLTEKANELGTHINTDCSITEIKKHKNGFAVSNQFFDAVIICGGGKAAPQQGSDGSCYRLVETFGHSVTPLFPALCGLTVNEKWLKTLKGVRCECNAQLYYGNRLLGEESGEVQFTDKGVSGIPVMNLSHLCKDNNNLKLVLDLCHNISTDELIIHIKGVKQNSPSRESESVLNGIINNKLGFVILEKCNIKAHTPIGQLDSSQITTLVQTIKDFTIKISGTRGFDNAQITCGGINTNEIDPKTMMSKLQKGLFICGEILDLHGDCGGYNLHLAWTTGRIAGNSAAEYLG